jgi:hypothetical protein
MYHNTNLVLTTRREGEREIERLSLKYLMMMMMMMMMMIMIVIMMMAAAATFLLRTHGHRIAELLPITI